LKYRTGEGIKKGNQLFFHGNPAEVELVACDPDDHDAAWHMKEFGGGVLRRKHVSIHRVDVYLY
jgi:hypothetical protein